ncbi:hypothetical protein BAOM_3379 [Peribacillus asahii]|uniref:Uncharacterized protein n=1 Tax=Peribacillus asahii TaxID=228899 RepID=A0A3T0KUK0_9BACI|nr:hypothetical protein BAOM_3379 [Peribacillus asahii]
MLNNHSSQIITFLPSLKSMFKDKMEEFSQENVVYQSHEQ